MNAGGRNFILGYLVLVHLVDVSENVFDYYLEQRRCILVVPVACQAEAIVWDLISRSRLNSDRSCLAKRQRACEVVSILESLEIWRSAMTLVPW